VTQSGRAGDGSAHGPLLEAVAVMDRLRSPGGCPWDAEQTHASLVRYLLEECYELVDAVESGDRAAIREELGDVLLQVLFHARIAAETPRDEGGFDIDDVAGDLVGKLVRRHPHVFADAAPTWTADDQQQRWDELKRAERGKSGVLDGVAFGQPALALAAKLGSRAAAFGLDVPPVGADPVVRPVVGAGVDPVVGAVVGAFVRPVVGAGAGSGVRAGAGADAAGSGADAAGSGGDAAGSGADAAGSAAEELFRIAYAAGARGEDPESALRAVARAHAEALAAAQARRDREPAGRRSVEPH